VPEQWGQSELTRRDPAVSLRKRHREARGFRDALKKRRELTMFVAGRIFGSAFAVVSLLISLATAAAPLEPVEVHAKLAPGSSHTPAIAFSVTNRSASSMKFNEHELPWGHSRSVVLLVVAASSTRTAVSQIVPLHNPIVTEVVLPPRETLAGSASLGISGKVLRELNEQGPILVLWSFVPRSSDGTVYSRQTGHVEIPKGQLAQR